MASCGSIVARLSPWRASLRINSIDLTMLAIASAVACAQAMSPRESSMIRSSEVCSAPLRLIQNVRSGPANSQVCSVHAAS